jgi:hypothetical protein
MRRRASPLAPIAILGGLALGACSPKDFDPSMLVESVRILASQSDQPYAKPGATVHSQVLAVDGRPDAASNEPMRVFWLPFVCVNPPNDAFYACFSQFESSSASIEQAGTRPGVDGGFGATITGAISGWDGGLDAGVGPGVGAISLTDGGAGMASIPTGVDISPFLIQGTRVALRLPTDIISSHPVEKGTSYPYGLAVVFNIACAGHIEIVALDPSNQDPEQIPFGCFNAQHQQLSANDYVIGYTEIFAYDTLTNQNPVISGFTFRDAAVPLDGGVAATVSFPHCASSNPDKCPDNIAEIDVPDASWEPDPQDLGPDGGPLGEQLWVDYYATFGTLSDDAILVFDPTAGRVTPFEQENLQDVTSPQRGTMWAVLHDNRGGAAWITVPLNAQ